MPQSGSSLTFEAGGTGLSGRAGVTRPCEGFPSYPALLDVTRTRYTIAIQNGVESIHFFNLNNKKNLVYTIGIPNKQSLSNNTVD